MNAIQSDRIHHAYLLTGSRGIGKTSIARIFAKSIRCPNAKWDGQWLRSCNECSSCREIAAGNSVDVIEIDGASNNGVDAVREIRESVKFMPSSGSRKIYIIDEVHMLTTAAFNALLKTLEEPPAHVIFILATTEPHKLPGTILSRVQRFDLKRFTPAQIQIRLEEVSAGEAITVELAALALLSRAADGSMRDALSLFDQVIAYAGKKITAAQVRDSIGLIESQTQLGILHGIFKRDAKSAIELVGEAYRAGHELKLLAKNLLEYLHAAILIKIGIESTGLELSADEIAELKRITANRELEEIELFFQAFQNGIEWIARSPQPKLVLEVLIVKCASAESLISMSGLGGAGATGARAPQTSGNPASRVAHSAPQASAPPEATKLFTPPPAAPEKKPGDLPKAGLLFTGSSPIALKNAAAAAAATPVAETIANLGASRLPQGPKTFEGFIAHVRASRPAIANALENAVCASFPTSNDQEFIVAFSPENDALYHGLLTSNAALAEFQKFTLEYFGVVKRILVEVRETAEVSLAVRRENDYASREKIAKDAAANHPLIAEARALFGGELGPIELSSHDEGEKK
jgi:DNA polymerase-3 subunit gamma/tau